MPTRWFVPVRGVDPSRVRLEQVHAAFSGWFDRTEVEHQAGEKPYSISPLTEHRGDVGVIVGTLSDYAAQRVCAAGLDKLTASGGSAPVIRLGNQWRPVGRPRRLAEVTWRELATDRGEREWRLEFLTPTTFRSGDRSSPLPSVETITAGLERAWSMWCDDPTVAELPSDPRGRRALWVTELDLRSVASDLRVGGRAAGSRRVRLSGVVGSMTLRVDDDAAAGWAGPLLRLAPYCGLGSMRAKGFGVVEVRARGSAARSRTA